MKTKNVVFLSSFIGTLFFTLISSSYLYITFKKVCKKIRKNLEKWDDIKSF